MQLGWPLPKRKELIGKLKPSGRSVEQKFQNKLRPFPIHRIPIEAPKYRLANGRTQAMQEEYLATHPQLPADFFSGDLESDAAQKVQHALLLELVNLERLFTYFKTNEQEEALVLTSTGFVVNGNRRLCAMRELYESDRKKFKRFEHIDVILLPECSEKDIDSLEADLQIKEDIKADYTWITKACMLRKRRAIGYGDVELARMYDMDPKELKASLALLADADTFLTSVGKPKQYHLLEKHEYAFKKLNEGRAKYKDEGEKAIFTNVSYGLIERPEVISGRLYKNIPEVAACLTKLIPRLTKEFPVAATPKAKAAGNVALLGGTTGTLGALASVIAKPENRERLLAITKDVIETNRSLVREKESSEFPLDQIKDAHTSLLDAYNALGSKTKRDGMAAQLDAIQGVMKKIRTWLADNA